jgi:hypothetical protein
MVGSGDLQQLQLASHCIDQGIGKALQRRDKKEAGKKKQKRSSRCILTTDCAWQWHQCLAHLHVLPAEFCAESALHSACLLPTSPLTSPRNLLMSTRYAPSLCTLQFCFAHNVAFLKSLVLPEINSSLTIDLECVNPTANMICTCWHELPTKHKPQQQWPVWTPCSKVVVFDFLQMIAMNHKMRKCSLHIELIEIHLLLETHALSAHIFTLGFHLPTCQKPSQDLTSTFRWAMYRIYLFSELSCLTKK